jgi:hypothetical protein
MKSANGTLVSNRRIARSPMLKDGDQIRIRPRPEFLDRIEAGAMRLKPKSPRHRLARRAAAELFAILFLIGFAPTECLINADYTHTRLGKLIGPTPWSFKITGDSMRFASAHLPPRLSDKR